MSSKERHKATWFQRDDTGTWQWQGFRDDLDTQEKVDAWLAEFAEEAERRELAGLAPKEVFILDLESANGMLSDLLEAQEELENLKEWLDEVVQIEKITVEEEFDEWCERKYREAEEEDDPGVDTSEEHVREGK